MGFEARQSKIIATHLAFKKEVNKVQNNNVVSIFLCAILTTVVLYLSIQ